MNMASKQKTTDSSLPSVPACFFLMRDIDRSISGFNICRALESIAGDGNIVGGGVIRGTFRIYPKTIKSRNLLLQHGVTIGSVHVNILDKSPNVVKDQTNPAEKLIIGNIPLSLATEEIHKAVKALGVSFRSNWFDERYRNDRNELSLFKTGRRFTYIDIPPKPLPKTLIIGDFNASIYHKSQKPQNLSPPNLAPQNMSPKNVSPREIQPSVSTDHTLEPPHTPHSVSQSEVGVVSSNTPSTPAVTTGNKKTKLPTKTGDVGKLRPTVRSLTRSANRKPKRLESESRSPSENSSAKLSKIVDYFDFDNSDLDQSNLADPKQLSINKPIKHKE